MSLAHNTSAIPHEPRTLEVNTGSSAFDTLFRRLSPPTFVPGTTKPIEGTTEYEHTKAQVIGTKDLASGLTIDGLNDELVIRLNDTDISITLDHGNHTAEELRGAIETALVGKTNNITVSLVSNRMVLTTVEEGANQRFNEIRGSGYDDIFRGVNPFNPSPNPSTSYPTISVFVGVKPLTGTHSIDETNNELAILFRDTSSGVAVDTAISINLDHENNLSRDDLISRINAKITAAGHDSLVEAFPSGTAIRFRAKSAGPQFRFQSVTGNFRTHFLDSSTMANPTYFPGTDNSDLDVFIVGRRDLSEGVTIEYGLNDVLIFDLTHNGSPQEVRINLTPNFYEGTALAEEIDRQLDALGISHVRAYFGVLTSGVGDDSDKIGLRYTPSENGSHVIDGIRGSSAFSIFYDSTQTPRASKAKGSVDISRGVVLQEGEFTVVVNNAPYTIELDPGSYTGAELVGHMNALYEEASIPLVAKLEENRLSILFRGGGAQELNAVLGSAANRIFFHQSFGMVFPEPDTTEEERLPPIERLQGITERSLWIQAGPNKNNAILIQVAQVNEHLLRLEDTTISQVEETADALERVDSALARVVSERGRLGSISNRVQRAQRSQENYHLALLDAESRIRDLDMAQGVMEKVRLELLHNVQVSMQAHTQTESQQVLRLLE